MSIQFIQCPYCGCPMTCPLSMIFHLGKECQTEKHKALQAEYDAGIFHPYNEKIKMIPIPQLICRIPK